MRHQIKKYFISLLVLMFSFAIAAQSEPESAPQPSIPAAKASQSLLMDIKSVAEGRLVAVGERGHIVISDDQGSNWRQTQVPTSSLLTKLFFIDQKVGWAVGHQQVILKTIDAGETWQLQNYNNSLEQPALFDIWFENQQQGIAVGAYGLFLRTEDGGATWDEIYQDSLEDEEIGFPHFYSLAFDKKSKNLFLAGELGLLAVSEDSGESWQQLESPYDGSFFHIAALNNGYLVVMGLRGHLFRSTDAAQTWQEVETNTFSGLQSMLVMPNRNKLIIVGSNGTQLISEDNANSVRLIQRNDRTHLAAAVETRDKTVLLVGVNGVLKADF
jgi:photosystem II stability/assembly factor-like uncharacterized protein